MVNKERRSEKIPDNNDHSIVMSPDPNGQMTSSIQSNNQSDESFDVKEESGIKQEPVVVDELIDVPASAYTNATHVSDSNGPDGGYDFDFSCLIDVKIEVKKECDEKREEEQSKFNGNSGKDAANNHPDQRIHDEVDIVAPENDDNSPNTQKQDNSVLRNPSTRHKCGLCEYSTKKKDHLKQHLTINTGEKPHACNFCPKRFTRKQYLRDHMKAHVKDFLFYCSVCLQGFDVANEKNKHEIICKNRRYECHLCQKSFGSMKENMVRHMSVHSGNKPFECKECFKQFKEKSSLNRHMKLHAGVRSFRCSKCCKRFSHQEERSAHEEMCRHLVFECDICGKSFGYKSHLEMHMRTHSGDKPFQCQLCQCKFTRKSNLKTHLIRIHNETR